MEGFTSARMPPKIARHPFNGVLHHAPVFLCSGDLGMSMYGC
jgi:hypothetical protein